MLGRVMPEPPDFDLYTFMCSGANSLNAWQSRRAQCKPTERSRPRNKRPLGVEGPVTVAQGSKRPAIMPRTLMPRGDADLCRHPQGEAVRLRHHLTIGSAKPDRRGGDDRENRKITRIRLKWFLLSTVRACRPLTYPNLLRRTCRRGHHRLPSSYFRGTRLSTRTFQE